MMKELFQNKSNIILAVVVIAIFLFQSYQINSLKDELSYTQYEVEKLQRDLRDTQSELDDLRDEVERIDYYGPQLDW